MWRRAYAIGLVLALAAGPAGAQRYSRHFDPAHPDAFDRYWAKVKPSGVAAAVGATAAASALDWGDPITLHRPSHHASAAERARWTPIDVATTAAAPDHIDLLHRSR